MRVSLSVHACARCGHAATGNTVDTKALYAAQKRVRQDRDATWEEKFDALPDYLSQIVRSNKGSIVDCEVNEDGEFTRLFVLIDAVVELIWLCGRYATRARVRCARPGPEALAAWGRRRHACACACA